MGDNHSLMHYAVDDYGGQPGYMKPTAGIGEKPVKEYTFLEGEDGR